MRHTLLAILILSLSPALFGQTKTPLPLAQARSMLKDTPCPEGASAAACQSFNELVEAGDQTFLTPFSAVFMDPEKVISCTYVVFDTSDLFWTITLTASSKNEHLVILFAVVMWQNGQPKYIDVKEVPFVADKTTTATMRDGVVVSIDSLQMSVSGSYENTAQKTVRWSLTTMKSTLRTSVIWSVTGGQTLTQDTKALMFATHNRTKEISQSQEH
jgi:hypothetical protein